MIFPSLPLTANKTYKEDKVIKKFNGNKEWTTYPGSASGDAIVGAVAVQVALASDGEHFMRGPSRPQGLPRFPVER